jgi:hypothetical protein
MTSLSLDMTIRAQKSGANIIKIKNMMHLIIVAVEKTGVFTFFVRSPENAYLKNFF